MKDAPSHMMKFMRKVTKKNIKDTEDDSYKKEYRKDIISKKNRQKVKKNKAISKKAKKDRVPEKSTTEEKNKKMKKRTPIVRERWSHHKMKKRLYSK